MTINPHTAEFHANVDELNLLMEENHVPSSLRQVAPYPVSSSPPLNVYPPTKIGEINSLGRSVRVPRLFSKRIEARWRATHFASTTKMLVPVFSSKYAESSSIYGFL